MPNIIGGKYRRTVLEVPNKIVRPTSALKREAIFSILESYSIQNSIEIYKDKSIIDIFAGSGLIGLEAISRGIEKSYFIENKIPKALLPHRVRDKKKVAGKIIIGLIGFLRYELPILRLIKFVENNSSLVTLKVFGDGQFKHYFDQNQSKNITYYGSFKNPDELNEIYKKIDINYVVYDPSSLNVRLALPNKLYESVFFRVPIICSTNTYLSKLVREWDIGDEIDISSQLNFDRDFYKYLKADWIQSKSNNCLRIPNKSLIDDQEKELRTIIMGKNKKHETSVSKF